MKKILSIAILLSGIGFGAFAQEKVNKEKRQHRPVREKKEWVKRTPEEIATKRTEMLDKELNFTDQQRQEVYKLNLERAQKAKAMQERRRQEHQVARKEFMAHREKFEKILTEEQKQKLKNKYSKESGAKFRKGRDMEHRRMRIDSLKKKENSVG